MNRIVLAALALALAPTAAAAKEGGDAFDGAFANTTAIFPSRSTPARSTTPLRSAAPCSIVGIAFGPPR